MINSERLHPQLITASSSSYIWSFTTLLKIKYFIFIKETMLSRVSDVISAGLYVDNGFVFLKVPF